MIIKEAADIASLTLEPGTIENGVLIGRDRYLFLAGGAHTVLDIVDGARTADQQSLRNFRDNIMQRRDWATQRNVPYLHLVFPDKQSIVPELWPFERCLRLGDLYLDRWIDEQLPVLYPVSLLRDVRDRALSRVDTHVTPVGSIYVAAAVVDMLTGHDSGSVLRRLLEATTQTQRRSGDLGSKLSRPLSALDQVFSGSVPGRSATNGLEGGNNGLVDLRVNPDAPLSRRCVFFGDSFGRDICQYLQFWFKEVLFFRTAFFHRELAEQCQPDLLVTENVERYLDVCLPDSEAPEFSSYTKRVGITYAPSQQFQEMLTGVLRRRGELVHGGDSNKSRNRQGSDSTHVGVSAGAPLPAIVGSHLPSTKLSSISLTADRQADIGDERIVETVKLIPRILPAFFIDQSGASSAPSFPAVQDIHSTLFSERADVLLFGPSIQTANGQWWTESRAYGEQFVDMVASDAYRSTFPGPKPLIKIVGTERFIDFTPIVDEIDSIEEPLFLATPLEPQNWGRWISSVISKVEYYRHLGAGRKLLCVAGVPWQRKLLAYLGVQDHEVYRHDPGRTYYCRDLASIEYNVANMTVSGLERERFQELREECSVRVGATASIASYAEKIFVSRLSASRRNPTYRALQNEEQLIEAVRDIGYEVVEPEFLPFDQQVAIFGNARSIVCLGGAAIYNACFCRPDTSFVSIESSHNFLNPHMNLLSSLKLRYGIILGSQDQTDPSPTHKRWTIDVQSCISVLHEFER